MMMVQQAKPPPHLSTTWTMAIGQRGRGQASPQPVADGMVMVTQMTSSACLSTTGFHRLY